MLLTTLLAAAATAATVSVNGGTGCFSAVAVQVELDEIDGLIGSDRVLVDLVRLTDPWSLQVRVVRREVEVWQRALEVTQADCSLLPAILARTLERGLEGVPRWPLANERRRWLLGVETAMTVPFLDWGAGVVVGRGPRTRGVWSWEIDVGAFTRSVQPVGPGRSVLSGGDLGFGPVAEARVGATRIGVKPRLTLGIGSQRESGITSPADPEILASTGPRFALTVDARARLPRGGHVGLRMSYVAVRTSFVFRVPGVLVTTSAEPRWRMGLIAGIRGPVGK
ncbi:MAG: hypothetical protein AAF211_26290 [Myxococcota bacterium]